MPAPRDDDVPPLPYASPPPPYAEPAPDLGRDIIMSLVSAGLFLYVGFGLGLEGISGEAVYDGSVAALTWGARIVGIGILLALGLSFVRVPGAAVLDLLLAALATLLCAGVGVIWLVFGDGQGILLLLFALLNGASTRDAWLRWRRTRIVGAARFDLDTPDQPPVP